MESVLGIHIITVHFGFFLTLMGHPITVKIVLKWKYFSKTIHKKKAINTTKKSINTTLVDFYLSRQIHVSQKNLIKAHISKTYRQNIDQK